MKFSSVSRRTKTTLVVLVSAIMVLAAIVVIEVNKRNGGPPSEISVTGLVKSPSSFSIENLQSMPTVTVRAELICVDGVSLGTHNWTGVRLSYLLNASEVDPDAIKVAFFAQGYATDLTIQDAMRNDVIVAYLKDGSTMSEHTRLVVPGKWGYKWIADLTSIELMNSDFKGKWESKGYSDLADIPSY